MDLRGTNQESGRPYNRRIVLETIRLHAPIARGEIARRVGLTIQTVSTITRELEAHDFVRSVREPRGGRGHPPAMLSLNPEGGFAIGLHVTPIGVEAALIDLAGDLVARRADAAAPTDPTRDLRDLRRPRRGASAPFGPTAGCSASASPSPARSASRR